MTFDLFDPPPDTSGMVRRSDKGFAHAAAEQVAPKRGKIQQEVIEAYRRHGPMSSKACEALPEFAHYGRSTVQKRISELYLFRILDYQPDSEEAIYSLNEERVLDPILPVTYCCSECGQSVTQRGDV